MLAVLQQANWYCPIQQTRPPRAIKDPALETGGIAARNTAREALMPAASPLIQLVSSWKQPDFSLTPHNCMQHAPTLVGEVAYHNEIFSELQNKLAKWTATQDLAQISIGINIDDESEGASHDPYLTVTI